MSKDRPLVYSTDVGFQKTCEVCHAEPCCCWATVSLPPNGQTVAIHFEKKGRGGKTVTILRGLQLTEADLKTLGKDLKQACGTGGTVKDGTIEIQGDHREKLAARLKILGYRTKFVGG
jgi:translation initiation factor 1